MTNNDKSINIDNDNDSNDNNSKLDKAFLNSLFDFSTIELPTKQASEAKTSTVNGDNCIVPGSLGYCSPSLTPVSTPPYTDIAEIHFAETKVADVPVSPTIDFSMVDMDILSPVDFSPSPASSHSIIDSDDNSVVELEHDSVIKSDENSVGQVEVDFEKDASISNKETTKVRKRYKARVKKPVDPEVQKQKYLERRRKNNIASRGSRAKTKKRFEEALAENVRLSEANSKLEKENMELKRKLQQLLQQTLII